MADLTESPTSSGPAWKRAEHQATRLLALSFDGAASPSITLKGATTTAADTRDAPYGWGLAWYPGQGSAALVVKDPTSIGDNAMTKLLRDWERFESTVFVCHLRGAARTLQEQDTHPFARSHGRRDWVLAHNGDLFVDLTRALPLGDDPVFEPVGRTDSEHAFCWLLAQVRARRARRLVELGWEALGELFAQLDAMGTANFLLTDGVDLAAYSDGEGYNPLHWARFLPPHPQLRFESEDIVVDLDDAIDRSRSVALVATRPMSDQGWQPMRPGQLLVLRRGAVIHDSHADARSRRLIVVPRAPASGPASSRLPPVAQPRAESALQHPGRGASSGPFAPPPSSSQVAAPGEDAAPPLAPEGEPDSLDTPPTQEVFTSPLLETPPTTAAAAPPAPIVLTTPAALPPPVAAAPPPASPLAPSLDPSSLPAPSSPRPPVARPLVPPPLPFGPPSPAPGAASVPVAAPLPPAEATLPLEAPGSRLPGFTLIRPGRATQGRLLRVVHETVYRYESPVERSSHLYRLRPVHDLQQEIVEHELSISVNGLRRDYEDVFGNQATSLEIGTPYTELRIEARSLLRLFTEPSPHLLSPSRRVTLPLVWMPWQRQMMLPYLLPPELPETQLTELYEYAMSFVERQDSDLVQTLLDMNLTIYRDYRYVSGSTDLGTTPFDVYCSRQGVCQDFANLMICLARLLGIPARYRVGYIYTGASYANQIQSEASHAWLEVYLPRVGWQGFDPTNGCLVNQDHIRIASGRNYRDATPTSGTLYKGGQGETLSVTVRVEDPG